MKKLIGGASLALLIVLAGATPAAALPSNDVLCTMTATTANH